MRDLEGREVNEMWLEFRSTVDELKEKHVPRFTGNRKRKQKWMDYGACKAVKKKYKARKRFTDTPGCQSYEEFKRARNKATTELRRAKRKFEEKLAEGTKKDSTSFSRYVESKLGTREKIGPLKDDSGNVLTEAESMGELLNRFLASVFSKEQGHGKRNVARGEDDQAEVGGGGEGISVVITEVMVREHLARLGENKAPGTDGMGSSFVKNLVGGIKMPVVLLFQRSLETGQVLEQRKEANVTAIYKRKGKRCDPGNYRPASLTFQVGNLFERIIRDYLVKFLEENKLRDSQHGFRTKRSCLTNPLEFLDLVSDCVD